MTPPARRPLLLSMVVYTRNEEPVIADFLHRVTALLDDNFELFELVLVDDASDDGTADAAREAAESCRGSVVVIELARRHGVEAAMGAGLDRCIGDWIIELESADIDFEPELLIDMYERACRGYDIVTASGDRGPLRSRVFYALVNRYAELDGPLRTEHVRLVSRRSVNAMLAMKEKVRYRKALYAVVGGRHDHVTYQAVPKRLPAPTRRLNRETSSLAFDVLLSFSGFGLRVAHRLSFAFGALSFLAVVYAVCIYALRDNVVEGWTTVTVVLSGGLAGIFLVLGIIGEYLARILVEVRNRPLYAVREATTHVAATADAGPTPAFLLSQVPGRANAATDIGDPPEPLPEPT